MILIVEDEPKIAQLLADYLTQSGYACEIVHDGNAVIPALNAHAPELILLDLMLPNKDGLTLCREIKQRGNTPVIMVTARVEEIDRLLGLELGADDYICKPFSPREVVARVKAVLRRSQPAATVTSAEQRQLGPLTMNDAKQEVRLDGREVHLTAIEYHLLKQLVSEPGRIYSRNQLMEHIYQDHRIVSDRTVDSHIKKLRKKLSDSALETPLIHSVYGVGYKFELP